MNYRTFSISNSFLGFLASMLLRISAWKSDSYSANALIVAFSVEICQVIKDLYNKHDYIFDRNCLNEDEKEHF
nr:hypothetical protein [uncultured Acetatifactor sp.]